MIILKNSIFYDVPKTGGSWISEGLVSYGIGRFEVGTSHQPPQENTDLYSFTFIRHPVSWYRSMYSSMVDKGKNPKDFSNWLRGLYQGDELLGKPWRSLWHYLRPFLKCDLIGRTEYLNEDFDKILTMLGEDYDKEMLDRPWVNVSNYKFQVSPEDKRLIEKNERRLIKDFYEKLA